MSKTQSVERAGATWTVIVAGGRTTMRDPHGREVWTLPAELAPDLACAVQELVESEYLVGQVSRS